MELHIGTLLFILSPCLCAASGRFLRFLNKYQSNKLHSYTDLGDLVRMNETEPSDVNWRHICSTNDHLEKCELEIVNNADDTYLLCWVDDEGGLHHYSPVNDASIRDGSVSNSHLASTFTGHSFVCIKRNTKLPSNIFQILKGDLICLYRPKLPNKRHILQLSTGSGNNNVHITLTCEPLPAPSEIINTSDKKYLKCKINNFQVNYEESSLDTIGSKFLEVFTDDLDVVCALLPPKALQSLQKDTVFWINKSLVYGTKARPIIGKGCCFHPKEGVDWLCSNGMNELKCGGIEIYSTEDYVASNGLWGRGGVLIHELSHAYHNKHCPNGFDCDEIQQAYSNAMCKKLYHAVAVHGAQGKAGLAKAYACMNAMEFWAELSTAYHWVEDENTEFNKWFPHNRFQLIQYDFDSFLTLHKLWGN